MTKTLNHIIFFPPPKSEYFFSNIGNENIFLEKKHNPPPPFKLNGRSLIFDQYQYVVDQHVLSVYAVIIHIHVHDPLCIMDIGIYCLSFELALKLYERKTTKI